MTPEEKKLSYMYDDRDEMTIQVINIINSIKTDDNAEELDVLFRLIIDLKSVSEKIGKFEQLTIKG